MKIILENLGVLKHAEFELGDLTVICGKNNSGKTYATHALYGFLSQWRELLHSSGKFYYQSELFSKDSIILDKSLKDLTSKGVCEIKLRDYIKENRQNELKVICSIYGHALVNVLAAYGNNFLNSRFTIELSERQDTLSRKFNRTITIGSQFFIQMTKKANSPVLKIIFWSEREKNKSEYKYDMRYVLSRAETMIRSALLDIIYSEHFPDAFIISTERTGATLFKNELDFARSRIVEEMDSASSDEERFSLLEKAISRYPSAVRENIDYIRGLDVESKDKSFLVDNKFDEYNNILEDLRKITGGDYIVDEVTGEPIFIPHNSNVRLKMGESSSSVRALAILYFYLFHTVKKGDLLIIDEPELDLHPENQRRLARLLARLVNAGIKVFITTHSDYIIGELNNLISMNEKNLTAINKIEKNQPYKLTELLNFGKNKNSSLSIKAYIAGEQPTKNKVKTPEIKNKTLTEVKVLENGGLFISAFDTAINMINEIRDEIEWG